MGQTSTANMGHSKEWKEIKARSKDSMGQTSTANMGHSKEWKEI